MSLINYAVVSRWIEKAVTSLSTAISTTSTLAVTGATTLSSTLAVTGTSTLTGGVVATSFGRRPNIPLGAVAYGSLGTDTFLADGTIWFSEIELPVNKTLTGIGVLNGTVAGGTDKLIVALYSSTGTLLANSALAGTATSGTDAFQEIPFTATYAAVGPARYWLAVQGNGTTDKIRTIAASTYPNWTNNVAGTFGTLPSLTPATSTAANKGPIGYVY